MSRRVRRFVRWLLVAAGLYLLLIVLVFAGQMIGGALRDPDADLAGQSLDPALTAVIESVRTIVAANRTPVYQRDAHAKAHGCVRAIFEVPEPEQRYAYGVLAHAGSYEAFVRFSNGTVPSLPDTSSDARGMAIKLLGVEGQQLLDPRLAGATQDFLMVSSPRFFIRRIDDYAELERQSAANTPFRFFFANNTPNPFRWHLRELWLGLSTRSKAPSSPLAQQYWSMSAYRLGPNTVKFSARACDAPPAPGVDRSNPNFLRDAMKTALRQKDACFQFMIQLRDEDARMPIEDTTVAWSEKRSPFVPVARLFIPAQDFDTPEQNALCENLAFNPWHGLTAHEPLGKLNQLRRELYLATAAFRRGRNGVELLEPRSWCDALPSRCRDGKWVD